MTTDIKSLIDPTVRHVFLTGHDISYAFPIIGVDGPYIFFCSQRPLEEAFERGHFLATDNKGIVQFDNPVIDSLSEEKVTEHGAHIHRLDLSDVEIVASNRRDQARYVFDHFVPFTFSVFGESIPAQLVNISDGGLRMQVNVPVKKNIFCQLQLRLPFGNDRLSFLTNAIVVYVEKKSKLEYTVGLNFVAPDFQSETEKQDYIEAKEKLRAYILQNIS